MARGVGVWKAQMNPLSSGVFKRYITQHLPTLEMMLQDASVIVVLTRLQKNGAFRTEKNAVPNPAF